MQFSVARLPRVEFGAGSVHKLPELINQFGSRMLLVTGQRSLRDSAVWPGLSAAFESRGIRYEIIVISGEPSPQMIDQAVAMHASAGFDVVVGLGGGSALDAAKAIAGLLRIGNSVMDYLEGVGPELPYHGPSVPFIAVPTTAGTGSEATKNAVLSIQGKAGFKKSFRDDKLVAQYAVLDPDLLSSCPPDLIAANGMDAITQLLESYVSTKANPFTDALALSGLQLARTALFDWYHQGAGAKQAQAEMLYASWLSGITLAQVGLGSVHGLASPLGAFFPIPHGVVCGTLLGAATEINIRALQTREPHNPALQRYAHLAEVLCQQTFSSTPQSLEALVNCLNGWVQQLQLPGLANFGISESDFPHIVKNCRGSSMRTNPIVLTDDEVTQLLRARLN
ncbi:MAG: iron-containing alcohol dehydrogenase [Gammaproteobacteria bacterium]|nr:iron-containing alcohol dehydrogenase [Gammaproteobacteria bacterium]